MTDNRSIKGWNPFRIDWSSLGRKVSGLAIATAARHWMSTLDYRACFYDDSVDPAADNFVGPTITLGWHEYITFLFYLRGYCNIGLLVSRHRDAEILNEAARHMGYATIRGSTNRGGTMAIRELQRRSQTMNVGITPDGPRGPRRRVAAGAIYLSSRQQIPLVLMGMGYDQPYRFTSAWDQFAIPRLYSRARAIASPRIQIPADLDRDGIEHYRQRIESMLNRFTREAEYWAESHTSKLGEVAVVRKAAPIRPRPQKSPLTVVSEVKPHRRAA